MTFRISEKDEHITNDNWSQGRSGLQYFNSVPNSVQNEGRLTGSLIPCTLTDQQSRYCKCISALLLGEFPAFMEPKLYYCVQQDPLLDPFRSQMQPLTISPLALHP